MAVNIHQMYRTREESVDLASQKYFTLFMQDWAERRNLDPAAEEEFIEILKDAFFFTEALLEENDVDEDTLNFENKISYLKTAIVK